MNHSIKVIVVLGRAGAGKTSLCARLAEKSNGYKHVAVGQLLRDESLKETEIGYYIQQCFKKGVYIPSSITDVLLEQYMYAAQQRCLEEGQECKLILDAYPANLDSYYWLMNKSDIGEIQLLAAVYLDCDDETCMERCLDRGKTSQRLDDNLTSVKNRFFSFTRDSYPVVQEFSRRKLLYKCISNLSRNVIFDNVYNLIGHVLNR